jgi:hypothetical protein
MAKELSVRVGVERKRSGCGTALLVMILPGLATDVDEVWRHSS